MLTPRFQIFDEFYWCLAGGLLQAPGFEPSEDPSGQPVGERRLSAKRDIVAHRHALPELPFK